MNSNQPSLPEKCNDTTFYKELEDILKKDDLLALQHFFDTGKKLPQGFVNGYGKLMKMSPLHIAARYNAVKCLLFLLDRCFDPNIRDYDRNTPLHHAANTLSKDAMRILLDRGANPNAADSNAKTPVFAVVDKLSFPCLVMLIRKRANLHDTDFNGDSPLHYIMQRLDHDGSKDYQNVAFEQCLEYMIKNGADPTLKNYENRTFLQTQEYLHPNEEKYVKRILDRIRSGMDGDDFCLEQLFCDE